MMRLAFATVAVVTFLPNAAVAQDHSGHSAVPSQEVTDCEAEAARHRAMGHPVPADQCAPVRMEEPPQQPVDAIAECEAEAARHRAMGHAVPPDQCAPTRPEDAPVQTTDPMAKCEAEAARHRAMGHAVSADSCKPMEAGGMEMGATAAPMDHGAMGHQMPGTMPVMWIFHPAHLLPLRAVVRRGQLMRSGARKPCAKVAPRLPARTAE